MQPESLQSIGPVCQSFATCGALALTTYQRSISSVGDSPAKTSAMPDNAPESPESDPDYGQSLPDSFANYDPDMCLWKTYQLCLFEDYQLFLETWPRSGMMRNGSAYRRRPLVPRIGAIESSLWPTPVADGDRTKNYAQGGRSLGATVRMYPTPTVPNGGRSPKGGMSLTGMTPEGKKRQVDLAHFVRQSDGISGQLNPAWVEWLMGFPLGWTDLED